MPEHIAAIVVNYGTADLAIQAVESLLEKTQKGCRLDVHLVDNASPGQDREVLRAAHAARDWGDTVTLWLETENHGFGRGNNVVLQALASRSPQPSKVLLLNPDARLENDVIAQLSAALDNNPQAAAAGARVLRPDHSFATGAFRFPSLTSEMARLCSLGFIDRMLAHRLVALPAEHPAGPVDWVSGASVMFRFTAIADIGFFDPGFFLYYEEVDLMRRLKDAEWQVLYVPQACVIHEEGAATGQFAGRTERKSDPAYLYHSWRHYFTRANGRRGATVIALLSWPAACINILHNRLRGRTPAIPIAYFKDHWRLVLRPLLLSR